MIVVPYAFIVGKIIYALLYTRPNIFFVVQMVSKTSLIKTRELNNN